MKRIETINLKLKNLYHILFNDNDADIKDIKKQIKLYESEKNFLYKREYNKLIQKNYWLLEQENYKNCLTQNIEFNCLFLELITKYPYIITNDEYLSIIVTFINKDKNRIANIRELLSLNKKVFDDIRLLKRLNEVYYNRINNIFKSYILMNNPGFKEYLLTAPIIDDNYQNILLMEQALKEGLDYSFVFALGSEKHIKEFFSKNMSKDLLDHIAKAKTKNLKKQILSIIYNCHNDKILNILVRYFEIEDIRIQLLNENSLYYKFLIKPLSKQPLPKTYGSIESLLQTCNYKFDDYIMSCDDVNSLIHSFDDLVVHYIYYHKDKKIHQVPVVIFCQALNREINKFYETLDFINLINSFDRESLVNHYKNNLNDDLKVLATRALIYNQDTVLSEIDIEAWNRLLYISYIKNPIDLENIRIVCQKNYDEFQDSNQEEYIAFPAYLEFIENKTDYSKPYMLMNRK